MDGLVCNYEADRIDEIIGGLMMEPCLECECCNL